MRTTLSIDDDVLAAAKHLAERNSQSVGVVISNLARQGLTKARSNGCSVRNGVLLLPTLGGGTPVNLKLVNQQRAELSLQVLDQCGHAHARAKAHADDGIAPAGIGQVVHGGDRHP